MTSAKQKTVTTRSSERMSCNCPTCGRSTTLYAFRDQKVQRLSEAYKKRIQNLTARFELEGYTTYQRDLDVVTATAQIMSVEGEKPHLKQILDHHAERLVAWSYMEAR